MGGAREYKVATDFGLGSSRALPAELPVVIIIAALAVRAPAASATSLQMSPLIMPVRYELVNSRLPALFFQPSSNIVIHQEITFPKRKIFFSQVFSIRFNSYLVCADR